MTRVFVPFAAGMVALGALSWALASVWPSAAPFARGGIALATVAGVGGLLVKAQALRRSVKGALGWTVALFFARVVLWGAGMAFLRSRGATAGAEAFTVGFCAVFGVGLWLEISFVLAASRRQQRGAA